MFCGVHAHAHVHVHAHMHYYIMRALGGLGRG